MGKGSESRRADPHGPRARAHEIANGQWPNGEWPPLAASGQCDPVSASAGVTTHRLSLGPPPALGEQQGSPAKTANAIRTSPLLYIFLTRKSYIPKITACPSPILIARGASPCARTLAPSLATRVRMVMF
eukprot:scaffold7882_cov140-Isochrysis_galbana.AAC.5